jgi:hypothetical protein
MQNEAAGSSMDARRSAGPRRRAIAALLVTHACLASAGGPAPAARAGEASATDAEMLSPGLYRITGAAGGTLLRVGQQGVIVVDAGRAGTYDALMAPMRRLAKLADLPAKALVMTAAGPAQAGNVAQFRDAGFTVVVQKQAVAPLAAVLGTHGAAAPQSLVTYDADRDVRAGDVRAEVEHVGRGRTGSDSVVFFRDLRVVAVGELYTRGTPQPDCASGGSFAGWAAAISHVSWLDFDVAVASRGEPVGKRELMAFKAKLEALARSTPAASTDCPAPQ